MKGRGDNIIDDEPQPEEIKTPMGDSGRPVREPGAGGVAHEPRGDEGLGLTRPGAGEREYPEEAPPGSEPSIGRPEVVVPTGPSAPPGTPDTGVPPMGGPPATAQSPPGAPGAGVPPPLPAPPVGLPLPGEIEEELPLPPPVPSLKEGLESLEEEFRWREDIKWVFGVLATVFLLAALMFAGLYRMSAFGNARKIAKPVLDNVTEIDSIVSENYQEIRNKAKRDEDVEIVIPGLEINVAIEGSQILETDLRGLQDEVMARTLKYVYAKGYKGGLLLEDPAGIGELRGKALLEIIIGVFSKSAHNMLLWPLAITGALAFAFGILLLLFARGWGKAAAVGLVLICVGLPFSFFIRFANEFLWKGDQGGYKQGVQQVLSGAGTMWVIYFDVALAVGAVLLLVGVIGGLVSRRRKRREVPFSELD